MDFGPSRRDISDEMRGTEVETSSTRRRHGGVATGFPDTTLVHGFDRFRHK
jgi:hypothetical protein